MKLQKNYLKKGLLAIAVSTALTGCFDDNDDNAVSVGPDSSATTSIFPVTVDVPASLIPQTSVSTFDWNHPFKSLMSAAVAAPGDFLEAENFKIVIVNSQGVITEEVPAEDIEVRDLGNGEFEITVPGDPRFDCLVVVDINGTLEITEGDTTLEDTNGLFAPTTSEEGFDIDLESSVAYQTFLNTFEEGVTNFGDDFDPENLDQVATVEQIIDNIETELESLNLEDLFFDGSETSISDLIAGETVQDSEGNDVTLDSLINNAVEQIIEDQVNDIANSVSTSVATIAETGIYWFEENEYGKFTAGSVETIYEFDDESTEWVGSTFDETTDSPDDDYFLTASGWAHSSDYFQLPASSVDTEAKTVKITDAVLDIASGTLTTLQALDLFADGERGIQDFVQTRDDEDLAEYLSASATFSEGAVAVKVGMSPDNENHILWFHDGEGEDGSCWGNGNEFPADYNGNCETVYVQGQSFATTLTDLVTDIESTPNDSAFFGFTLWGDDDQRVIVQLIETTNEDNVTSRNARFFTENDQEGYDLYEDTESGSQTTWSYTQPTGLAQNESVIELPIPEELQEIVEDAIKIFAVKDGYVRPGHKEVPGVQNDSDWVYNEIAANDILTAFLPTSEFYQKFSGEAFTVTMTSDSDLERLEFFPDGMGTIEFTSTSNELDINDLSTWTVDPAANELSFREFSDETNYWDWVLTVTSLSVNDSNEETINFTAAVTGVEDGQAVSGSGAGSMQVENFAYASSDLAGNTFYIAWYNEGDDEPECNVGWIEETLTFDNDGGYSIAEADCIGGETEQGDFSVSSAGIVSLTPTTEDTSNDFFQRVGIDTFYNADMICGDDTEVLAEQCTLDDVDAYLFSTESDRTAFITDESTTAIPQ